MAIDSKRRVFEEVGAAIEEVTNSGWIPNLKHLDKWN